MTIGRQAIIDVVFTKGSLDLVSSNSNEPSSTIKIKPIVPKIGKTEVKFGISILKKVDACFTPQPKKSNKMTDGIFVRDELMSNI